jgi:hypothetical protein
VAADPEGYLTLLELAESHEGPRAWAIEGTGGYGAGLTRFLLEAGEQVIELDRPERARRRGGAKSDPLEPIWVSVLKPWGSAAALGGLASPKVLAAAKPIGSSRLPWHFRDMPQIAGVALFGASRRPRERGPLRTDGSARECQTTSSSRSP